MPTRTTKADDYLGNWNKSQRRSRNDKPQRRSKNALCYKHRDQLLKAVSTPITQPKLTMGYRLSLALVAVAMLTLPVLYVTGTVLAIGWLLRHYFVHAHLLLEGVLPALCYLVPAFFGPFVAFFMVKPFFVKGSAGTRPETIDRKEQPVLYEYVERLCDSIGAPRPYEIRVNNEVNASASLSHGNPFSNKMTLTIGLPLVYGLSVFQLSGVLAHEFGHFAQRSGVRISYLIRVINIWFLQSLQSRDATHDWYDRFLSGTGWMASLGRFIFLSGVFTARCILWIPWMTSNLICCLLIRQMEFDADQVEAKLVGAATFRRTHRKIISLAVAEQVAHSDLYDYYEEGRLVNDFARLVAASLDDITPKLKKAIEKSQRSQETAWFDTHPSQSDRFASVESVPGEGTFVADKKLRNARATILFDSIGRTSRMITADFYREALGSRFKPGILYPTDDLLDRKQAESEADEKLRRYFQVRMPAFYPIPMREDATEPCESPRQTVDELVAAREEMIARSNSYRDLLARYDHAENAVMDAAAAVSLNKVGVRMLTPPVQLQIRQKISPEKLHTIVEGALGQLALEMLDYEEAAAQRLSAAMRLLANPKVAAKFEDGQELQERAMQLVKHTLVATDLMGDLRSLRLLCHRVVVVLSAISDEVTNEFVDSLITLLNSLGHRVKDLYWEMGNHEYPFDHGGGDKSIQEHVMPDLPDKRDISGLLLVSRIAFERLAVIQMRLFARLAVVAETVESRMGLKPLPLPPDPDDK